MTWQHIEQPTAWACPAVIVKTLLIAALLTPICLPSGQRWAQMQPCSGCSTFSATQQPPATAARLRPSTILPCTRSAIDFSRPMTPEWQLCQRYDLLVLQTRYPPMPLPCLCIMRPTLGSASHFIRHQHSRTMMCSLMASHRKLPLQVSVCCLQTADPSTVSPACSIKTWQMPVLAE